MRKTHRLTALVLAVVLLFALAVPAGAATPKLTYTQSGAAAKLTLQGLGGDSIYGVQLELTLEGSYENAVFSPASSGAYAPPCHRTVSGDTTQVTVYLTSQSPLNKSGSLSLGTLTLSASFNMPEAATVTLLDRDLKPLYDRQAIAVSRQATSSSSSSSGSGSGGSAVTPAPSPSPEPEPTSTPATGTPFTDVKESDWYYSEVKYVFDQGMMNGTAADSFAPNAPTSRAMLVTILYRLAGAPPALPSSFSDIAPGQYYTDAVGWAAAQNIVNGLEPDVFGPNMALTREQLAAILYRYSRAMGYDTTARGNLSTFTDSTAISDYARDPVAWAVASGLLSGMGDGTIAPNGWATRAQVATILTRFHKNIVAPVHGI